MILIKESWDDEDYFELINYIKSLKDIKYIGFQEKIIPGVKDLIGVRIPYLRKISKDISKGNWRDYLEISKDDYFEEIVLQGMVIGNMKVEFFELEGYIRKFVPKINNWSICDTFCSGLKQTKKYKENMFEFLKQYLYSKNPWEVRFSVVMMLEYFVDDDYIDEIFKYCNDIDSDEYYVKMAIAWLISVCFVKFEEKTMIYLISNELDNFTYNKALQKIIESNRVDKDTKDLIRSMKRKG